MECGGSPLHSSPKKKKKMKSCTNTNNLYEDVDFCPGQASLPGVRDHAYMIRRSDIAKWPTIPGNAAKSLDKVAVYSGNFTLAADKTFFRFDLVPNESEPTSEQVGTFGSYHFENKITLVLPGTGAKVTGLISEINNDDMVILVPQRDGKIRVFGNEMFQVNVKPSQAWGKGSSDPNTTTIEVTVEDLYATPFYPGTFETSSGTYSGATDAPATEGGNGNPEMP